MSYVRGSGLAEPSGVLARLTTAAIVGVDAVPVSVEVDVSGGGLPGLTMVGLPDATVRESRDRVRTAIRNAGFPVPSTRITVSQTSSPILTRSPSFLDKTNMVHLRAFLGDETKLRK